jgi:flagellar secretion chaperone FliS
MTYSRAQSALGQYNRMAVQGGIEAASPHRLIQMLLDGALEKVARAKGCMQRGEIRDKGQQVGWAISILEGLKASLNKAEGGEIAQNLEDLYIYMERRLIEANRNNDTGILDEVTGLLRQIKEAWDAIGEQVGLPPGDSATGR